MASQSDLTAQILKKVCAMLHSAQLPKDLWGEAFFFIFYFLFNQFIVCWGLDLCQTLHVACLLSFFYFFGRALHLLRVAEPEARVRPNVWGIQLLGGRFGCGSRSAGDCCWLAG